MRGHGEKRWYAIDVEELVSGSDGEGFHVSAPLSAFVLSRMLKTVAEKMAP